MNKRLLLGVIAVAVSVSCTHLTFATTISEANNKKKQAENALKDVNSDIEDIEAQEEAIEEESAIVQAELVDVILSIDIIKRDIKNKEVDIEVAKAEYEDALQREKSQKEAMNKRIKFMYEKGEMSYVELLLESRNYVESINRASFTEKLYEYDRYLLFQYQQTKEEVKEKKQVLEDELEELEEIKEDSLAQQKQLEQMIDEYSEKIANFKDQLISARSKAKEYQMEIERQSSAIKKLEEAEAKRKAEEARKAAEALARKKAQEEATKRKAKEEEERERRKAEEEQKRIEEGKKQSEEDNDNSETSIEVENKEESDAKQSGQDAGNDGEDRSDSDKTEQPKEEQKEETKSSSSSSGSSKGQEIASFATQFVGNPYVAGGTSLTNGADCSGFTQAVYSNFGISLPRTSGSQAMCGTAVDYSEAAPGDIIYYGGHVGIYIGNGLIVHASTQATGIKISNALYRSIISVRRIV